MKIGIVYYYLFVIALILSVVCQAHESFSNRRRRTKDLDEKINKLDDSTKQRIYAMKASGMPKEAIADKISYVAGGKGTAQRIVDALHDEKPKAKSPPKAPPSTKAKTSTSTKTNANTAKASTTPKKPQSAPTAQKKTTTTSSTNTKTKK